MDESEKRFNGYDLQVPREITKGKLCTRNTKNGRMEITLPKGFEVNGQDLEYYKIYVNPKQLKSFDNDPTYFHVALPQTNKDGKAWIVQATRDFGGWENPEGETRKDKGDWIPDIQKLEFTAAEFADAGTKHREARRAYAGNTAEDKRSMSPAAAKENVRDVPAAMKNTKTKTVTKGK